MILQISSGMGPVECRVAVAGILRKLKEEYPDIQIIQANSGEIPNNSYSSVIFSTESDLHHLVGTMQWICKSKYRKWAKRKNWFVDVSEIPEFGGVPAHMIAAGDIKVETLKSGGPGGQHVNKTETGVRATYLPLNISVMCTRTRYQHQNKEIALERLGSVIHHLHVEEFAANKKTAWKKQYDIVRGNPVRIYEGEDFKLKES